MKSTQDLIVFLNRLSDLSGKPRIFIQIFADDKSYRICDENGETLLDSDDADKPTDINDLCYDDPADVIMGFPQGEEVEPNSKKIA